MPDVLLARNERVPNPRYRGAGGCSKITWRTL